MKKLGLILALLGLLFISPKAYATISAPIAHTAAQSANTTTVTTSGINTTGANFLVVVVGDYSGNPAGAVTDSKSNTYVPRTEKVNSDERIRTYYIAGGAVGTSHTFTYTCDGGIACYPGIAVAAFSGVRTLSPYDVENSNGADGVMSLTTGSATPSQDGSLLIAGANILTDPPGTVTINSSFTITDTLGFSSGAAFAIALAYKIQTSLGAENPTWDFGGVGGDAATNITVFKPELASKIKIITVD